MDVRLVRLDLRQGDSTIYPGKMVSGVFKNALLWSTKFLLWPEACFATRSQRIGLPKLDGPLNNSEHSKQDQYDQFQAACIHSL